MELAVPVAVRWVGPYRIREKLGAGGMGEVYLAEDPRLRRLVALKTLSDSGSRTPEARRRILHEARAAARLNHPNVAAVYDVVDSDDGIHIVMEYVLGETLAARLRRGRLLPMDAAAVGIQLAEALSEAHAMGVLHRDLKPGNVILTPGDRVKVLDFGLAKTHSVVIAGLESEPGSQDRRSDERRVVGTPGYVPPESLLGLPVDSRGDIYSLGVTLFEMLTGRRPFQGADMMAVGLAALTRPPPRVRESDPDLPASLDAIVARAMAPKPEDRYGSAAEVAEALRGVQDLLPTGSQRVLRPLRLEMLSWRSPRLYVWSVVMVALAVFSPRILQQVGRGVASPAAKGSAVVAVLPLANTTGEPAGDDVGAGFADILISTLAQVPGVTMVSRSATLGHRERKQDLAAIAGELGADLIVDGAVQTSHETVRVTLRLVRPASNLVAWSRSYDGDFAGVFTLQNEAAAAVSQALQVTLTPDERRRLQRPAPTRNVEALAEYAQARSFLERPDVAGNLERSITLFERAIARDPRFARAHAGLGEACWMRFLASRDPAWSEKAHLATTESLRLDPEDASAHRALAVLYAGRGRAKEAIEELRRAIALEPAGDEAHRMLGEILLQQERPDEGFAELRAAIRLRPSYWRHHQTLGLESFRAGRYADALASFRRVTELQPDNLWGFSGLGTVLYAMGDTEHAIESFQHAIALGGDVSAHTNLGSVFYAEGRYAEAARAFEEAARLSPLDPSKHRNLGDAYERTGQRERARRAFERAVELCRERLRTNPRDARTLGQLAVYEAKLGSRADAARHADEAVAMSPETPDVIYRMAVVLALGGRAEESLAALQRAVDRGYSRKLAKEDDDLRMLRGRPEFERLTGSAVAVLGKGGTK